MKHLKTSLQVAGLLLLMAVSTVPVRAQVLRAQESQVFDFDFTWGLADLLGWTFAIVSTRPIDVI